VPFVKRIDEEIAPDEMTARRHPKVAAWWAAIQARPAFGGEDRAVYRQLKLRRWRCWHTVTKTVTLPGLQA
jgi:hypothetical protein